MSHPRARRHYRAAQKEYGQANISAGGIFIPEEHKCKMIAATITLVVLAFIKGIIIGLYFGNSKE